VLGGVFDVFGSWHRHRDGACLTPSGRRGRSRQRRGSWEPRGFSAVPRLQRLTAASKQTPTSG
jgi:hypothetical protein